MTSRFPAAVPEVPVSDINKAAGYYVKKLLEFTAKDLDGNLLGVFYDFSRDV